MTNQPVIFAMLMLISICQSQFVNDDFSLELNPAWKVWNDREDTDQTPFGTTNGFLTTNILGFAGNPSLWFNEDRGQALYQSVTIPTSGFDDYVYINIGVSPLDDLSGTPLTNPGDDYMFSGLLLHLESWDSPNYVFSVFGHRGANSATVENKVTINGVSTVTQEATNVFGDSTTRGDLRLRIDSSGTYSISYRRTGTTTWTSIQLGTGHDGMPSSTVLDIGTAGDTVHVGFIGYAYDYTLQFTASVESISREGTSGTSDVIESTDSQNTDDTDVSQSTENTDDDTDSQNTDDTDAIQSDSSENNNDNTGFNTDDGTIVEEISDNSEVKTILSSTLGYLLFMSV